MAVTVAFLLLLPATYSALPTLDSTNQFDSCYLGCECYDLTARAMIPQPKTELGVNSDNLSALLFCRQSEINWFYRYEVDFKICYRSFLVNYCRGLVLRLLFILGVAKCTSYFNLEFDNWGLYATYYWLFRIDFLSIETITIEQQAWWDSKGFYRLKMFETCLWIYTRQKPPENCPSKLCPRWIYWTHIKCSNLQLAVRAIKVSS